MSVPLTNDGDGEEEDARWSFPSTREERERYAVFKDLHDKSFYMTSGAKFGSDFSGVSGGSDPVSRALHRANSFVGRGDTPVGHRRDDADVERGEEELRRRRGSRDGCKRRKL